MSKLNINRNIFLEKEELVRWQEFLGDTTSDAVTLGNTTAYGILRTDFTGSETDFLVEQGTNSGTVKIVNRSLAIDSDNLKAVLEPIDNFVIPNDSSWYWLRVSHKFRRHEVGTVSVDINGNLSGVGTKFTEVLRGQATDVPTKIKFLDSNEDPASNSSNYEVVEVTDDENAVLGGNVSFAAESNLFYVVIGATPINEAITSEQEDGLYAYDDCLLELVAEESLDTPPTTGFVQDKTFYIARVQNTGVSLTIQDKRTEYWNFNIVGINDKLDKTANLSDLTDIEAARNNLGILSDSENEAKYLTQSGLFSEIQGDTDKQTARGNIGAASQSELNTKTQDATESTKGITRFATEAEFSAGSSNAVAITPLRFSEEKSFTVAPYTGNNSYTTVINNTTGKYFEIGNLVFASVAFTLKGVGGVPFADFEITTNFKVFSDRDYGINAIFHHIPGFTFNVTAGGRPDHSVYARSAGGGTVIFISSTDGSWGNGHEVDVSYQGVYVKGF